MLLNLKKKCGYISIESIIIVGLFISLGVYAISRFYEASIEQTENAMRNIEKMVITVPGSE